MPDFLSPVTLILILMILAHGFGYLFERVKQPPVIGEILGGLVLGPSLFGHFFPDSYGYFGIGQPQVDAVLNLIKSLGLQLLMFVSGMEIKSIFDQSQKRTIAVLTTTGAILPLVLVLLVLFLFSIPFFDLQSIMGPAKNQISLMLVVSVAVAVTSIPVLSRIFSDIGILNTSFARLVLGVAVLEDIILYVVLAIALGLVAPADAVNTLGQKIMFHVGLNIGFVILALGLGGWVIYHLRKSLFSFLYKRNSTASLLATMFIFSLVGSWMGVPEFLSAFLAGVAVTQSRKDRYQDLETVKKFAFSFFIPIYFALVGFRLNIQNFDLTGFIVFFIFACLIKLICVYLGGKIESLSHKSALHIAVAMNARGGPGIVLAFMAIEAQIINEAFYTTLILTVIFSSLAAGKWLEKANQKNDLHLVKS